MYVCREADDDPADPTRVSAGKTTTSLTPSSVAAICACTVTSPCPTSAAAVWTSTRGLPLTTRRDTRAVEVSLKPSE